MGILISGTCAPSLNSNYGLIESVAVGFEQLNRPEVKLVYVTNN